VAAVVSPRGTVESYQLLLSYLSEQLDRPVELVQRLTYEETNRLVESGEVDLAFVCTSAYITGHEAFDMQLLVAPQVNGTATYQSLLIVPTNSTAANIGDLRDNVFAFTDPISNTGRVYPTYLVQQLGFTPETFFTRTFFTYNHDDAIRAVASGLADGAAVDSLVYTYALERDPTLAEKVKVIHRSPDFGIPPVVVSPSLRPQLRALLQEILLTMDENPEGRRALSNLGIDKFVIIDNSAYDTARHLVEEVGPLTP
jgi:phosphonate transport system substrate-binding protein